MSSRIWLRRAYDPPTRNDGQRVLVDRLWPRGVKKEDLKVDQWLKEIAPSDDLRHWFDHDPPKWAEFQKRYRSELRQHTDELHTLEAMAKKGRVTLVYAAHDSEHNNAVALRNVLEENIAAR